MPHDDDFDDFSHLPSVDESPSAEEKKALWKQHSRTPPRQAEPQPEHTHLEEVMEEQLLAHELPVEQPFVEEHPSHSPEWAEDGYVDQTPADPQPEVQDWVREAFAQTEVTSPVEETPPRVTSPLVAKTQERTVRVNPARLESLASKKKPVETPRDEPAPLPAADDEAKAGKLPPRADDPAPAQKPPKPPRSAEKIRADKSVDDRDGDVKADADEPETDQTTKAEVPHGITHEPEPELTPKERFKKAWERIGGRALAASVAVHIVLLTLAAIWIVTYATEKEIDFLPGGGSKGAADAQQSLQHKVQQKKNVWLKNKQPLKRVVSTNISSSITLPDAPPDMDFPDASKLIGSRGMSGGGFGTSGAGKGFGSGLGFGGKISFMGNSGVGRNIVFVVDVSASMSGTGDSGTGQRISRIDLLKRELVKSIGRLPPNTQYQVIYFSDFAWPHNEVDSRNLKVFDKYRWNITPDKTSVKIPQYRYLVANSTNVAHSIELIKDADNPGGTNWGSGLCMALNGYPKPDIIFFMTDGVKLDAEGWVDAVSSFNLKGGKRTIIHTTAMMEPDAALELDQLAKRNGGNFTIVTAKGFTLTAAEFFKGSQ